MSDQKTIKFRFDKNEKTVPMLPSYKDCFEEFKKLFKISDEDAQRLSLFYYDSDGDQIAFQADSDYVIFITDETQTEKIIEGELLEKDKEEIIIEEKIKDKHNVVLKNNDNNNMIKENKKDNQLGNAHLEKEDKIMSILPKYCKGIKNVEELKNEIRRILLK